VTPAEARTALAEVEAKLAAGVSEASDPAGTIRYDLKALEAERKRLSGIVAQSSGSQFRRAVFRRG
jgi:hypothetical protein